MCATCSAFIGDAVCRRDDPAQEPQDQLQVGVSGVFADAAWSGLNRSFPRSMERGITIAATGGPQPFQQR